MNSVTVGLNLNTSISGIRFVGTATSADSVQGYAPADYLKRNVNEFTTGTLSILNDEGLQVGSGNNIQLTVDSGTQVGSLIYNTTDEDFSIKATDSINGQISYIYIQSSNNRIGIFTETPNYGLDVAADTRILGSILFEGTVTNINSTNLRIRDTNIDIGNVTSPTDITANGGGLTLKGSSDKTLTWVSSSDSWKSNRNFDLDSSYNYKINGTTVLTSSSLGTGIISAPALQEVGVLNRLTVTNVLIYGNTVTTVGSNLDLSLTANGSGNILVNNKLVRNLSTPVSDYDAATKKYVDDSVYLVGTKGFVFSIDVTNFVDVENEIIAYLNLLLPVTNPLPDSVFDLPDGVRARVLCVVTSATTVSTPVEPVLAKEQVNINGNLSSNSYVTDVGITVPSIAVTMNTTYTVRDFRVISGAWTFNTIVT